MADVAVFDSKRAEKFFKDIEKNVKRATSMHRTFVTALAPIVFQDVINHFEKTMGSQGRWDKWSDLYRKRQKKTGKGGNKILQDSGRLRNSFMPTNWRLDKNSVMWFNPAKTKTGFAYAAAHDQGWAPLPKRDFMWLSRKAISRLASVSAAYMIGRK